MRDRVAHAPAKNLRVAGAAPIEVDTVNEEGELRKLSDGRGSALNVFKYESAADETSAWGDQKILHHFEPGRKNLTVVSGIGSEAYLLQVVPDRKDFEGTIWIHKNLSHFRLIAVSEQSPSPDVLKAAAHEIAAKLP
jgi:hypothetical protein